MTYRPGDHLAICDRCGLRGYASEMKMTWDNWFVHLATCFEEKHPHYKQPRGLSEKQRVEVSRPEKTDTFGTITAADL